MVLHRLKINVLLHCVETHCIEYWNRGDVIIGYPYRSFYELSPLRIVQRGLKPER